MKKILLVWCCLIALVSFTRKGGDEETPIVKHAAMPSLTKDANGHIYIVFARQDKLEYIFSTDNGNTFSQPIVVDSLTGLYGVAGRGPHIISTPEGITIVALNREGNIYAYTKAYTGAWINRGKINDVPDVCKEGFLALSSKGYSVYAAWLDLRNTNKNKIVGALSANGGKTWSKNKIIYQSPDGSVCECCRVSVAFAKNDIDIMFRNNLKGNRNLYLLRSHDGGLHFDQAVKLGDGNWQLGGCPMDGGGMVVDDNGSVQTVWRRMDTIYSCVPGQPERMIGQGKNCTIESLGNNNIFAWIKQDSVVCLLPNGGPITVGSGSFPVLQAINSRALLCVWQNNNNLYRKVINF